MAVPDGRSVGGLAAAGEPGCCDRPAVCDDEHALAFVHRGNLEQHVDYSRSHLLEDAGLLGQKVVERPRPFPLHLRDRSAGQAADVDLAQPGLGMHFAPEFGAHDRRRLVGTVEV